MTTSDAGLGRDVMRDVRRVSQPDECPPWCVGCRPNDSTHRSRVTTIGREGAGWISAYLVADRGAGDEPVLRIQVTRFGSSERVMLTSEQTTRLIRELIRLPDPVRNQFGDDQASGGRTGG